MRILYSLPNINFSEEWRAYIGSRKEAVDLMKIINNIGIVLISLYFIFLGAYYVVYARILYTATDMVVCLGTDCAMLMFLKILAWVLGFVGVVYVILAIAIRFHRVGCYLALAACFFNVILMIAYMLRPTMFSLWLTLVFPIHVILTRSIEYAPAQAENLVPLLESGLELLMILLNIVIAAYLLKCLGREVWGTAEKKGEDEDEDDSDEDELREAVKKSVKGKK